MTSADLPFKLCNAMESYDSEVTSHEMENPMILTENPRIPKSAESPAKGITPNPNVAEESLLSYS